MHLKVIMPLRASAARHFGRHAGAPVWFQGIQCRQSTRYQNDRFDGGSARLLMGKDGLKRVREGWGGSERPTGGTILDRGALAWVQGRESRGP